MHARTEPTLETSPWAISTRTRAKPTAWPEWLAPFAVALALRAVAAIVLRAEPSWDGVVYARAAEQLAAGQGYTLRILDPSNPALPTAFYPVGYPAVLALGRALGAGLWGDRLLHVVCSALHVPLAFLLARRAFGARPASVAAWLTACWPGAILFSATWLAEPVFALACGVALLPVLYADRERRFRSLIMSSLWLGLAAYLRPSALLIAALLGALVGARHVARGRLTQRSLHASLGLAVAISAACLPLTPWMLRNQRALGSLVLVSTNGGVNLLIGALEEGGFERLSEPQPCRAEGLGEVERDRCFSRQGLEVIRREPAAWAGRALLKVAHTFGHQSAPAQAVIEGAALPASGAAAIWLLGVSRLAWLALLPCWLVGVVIALARARFAGLVLVVPVAAIAVLHTAFLGGDRYHGALLPMLAALAAIGALALARVVRASAAQ